MTRKILLMVTLSLAVSARADVSDSGNLTIGGQAVIAGSMTVTGPIGVSSITLSTTGAAVYALTSSTGIHVLNGKVKLEPGSYVEWPDGTKSTTSTSGGGGAGHLAAYFSTSTAKHIDRPTYSAWANDDSIPQISGGYAIVNGTMTATTTSDKVIFQWSVPICEPADNCTYGVICLFQDGNTNAFCCSQYDLELYSVQRYTWAGNCERQVSDLPTSDTNSHYYTLKIGDNGGSCISINGCASRRYGGASRATFTGQVWTP